MDFSLSRDQRSWVLAVLGLSLLAFVISVCISMLMSSGDDPMELCLGSGGSWQEIQNNTEEGSYRESDWEFDGSITYSCTIEEER
jgi:hypothetical protein